MSEELIEWNLPSMFKGILPADAYKEIELIKQKYNGEITSKILLDESRSEGSLFHKYFNWNNEDAAERYRIEQARLLLRSIRVSIIADGENRNLRVFEVVKMNAGAGVYKNIETFTSDDVDYIARHTLKQMNYFKDKLSNYSQFAIVVKHLNDAITELKEITAVK